MDTENQQTGDKLIRRPRHKLTADANYVFLEGRATANLQMQHVGKRKLRNDNTGDDYTLANLAISYNLSKNIEIFGRIYNLLDEKYQRVLKYRTYYGGVKVSF